MGSQEWREGPARSPHTRTPSEAYVDSLSWAGRPGPRDEGLVSVEGGVHPPYLRVGRAPRAAASCIFRTWSLRPPGLEGNQNPRAASSKQAMLGTMVSQFRKLRFPLMTRTTCGGWGSA